ncbi:MAG: VTT domain-containing protein [Cyanobacteria bacterium P01_C01_bin.72]
MGKKITKVIWSLLLILAIALVVISINRIGIETVRSQVQQLGAWGFLIVGGLRLTSVIIPALPGTVYSILAGGLFGFVPGLIIICLADLISCSLSFVLARRYGRNLVAALVGDRFLYHLDRFSQKKVAQNFWLMTSFLMTGLFDFVSYGIGLSKTPWRKFAPALIVGVFLSNPPIVALGAGLLESGKVLLGFAALGIFALGLITVKLESNSSDTNS